MSATVKKKDIQLLAPAWKNVHAMLKPKGLFTINNFAIFTSHQRKVRGLTYGEILIEKLNKIAKFKIVSETDKIITLQKQNSNTVSIFDVFFGRG
jgi:hypothetical protein